MMRLVAFLSVSLLTFLTGSASSAIRTWLKGPDTIPPVAAKSYIPPDTFITLERTGCLGSCPAYTLAVSADGSVVFSAAYSNGANQWKRTGIIKAHIDQERIKELLDAFDRARFFSLQDCYSDESDTCSYIQGNHATIYTSIHIDGQQKSVTHLSRYIDIDRRLFPSLSDLSVLEAQIDGIVNTKQWMP
jgi:hypothetical protein